MMNDTDIKQIITDDEPLLLDTASQVQATYDYYSVSSGDIDERWKMFVQKHQISKSHFIYRKYWIAACLLGIFGIVLASILPVLKHATAIENQPKQEQIRATKSKSTVETADSFIFDNTSLQVILNEIADYYGAKVQFIHPEKKIIRLYFQCDKCLSLKEVTDLLNHFNDVQVTLSNNVLLVE